MSIHHGPTGASPTSGHENSGTGTHQLPRTGELGLFSLGNRLGGILTMPRKGDTKKTEHGFFHWCPVPGQDALAQTGAQEIPPEHQEALLCCAGNKALTQVAQRGYCTQRGCWLSSLKISKSHLDMVLGTAVDVSA